MKIINIVIYLLVAACFIWLWDSTNPLLQSVLFYTLCIVGAILLVQQTYEFRKLNDKLNSNQRDNDSR